MRSESEIAETITSAAQVVFRTKDAVPLRARLISELFAESIDLAELSLEIENRLGLAYQIDTGAIASLNEKRNGTWDLTLSDLITFVSDKQHARSPEIANRDRTLNVSDHSGS